MTKKTFMKTTKSTRQTRASNLEKRFDAGKRVLDYFDPSKAVKGDLSATFRANVDFPRWMVEQLDRAADRLGVTRQSLIKIWIAERLKEETSAL